MFGEYHPIMRTQIDLKSEREGRNTSRLPSFSPAWTRIINGSADFLGLNQYSTYYAETSLDNTGPDGDADVRKTGDDDWERSDIGWAVVPWGCRKILDWISKRYGLPIFITENGYGSWADSELEDEGRVRFYTNYINEMLKAVKLDGANVKGYAAWSLMDNFEWGQGYK